MPLNKPEDASPITFYHVWHVGIVTLGLSLLAAAYSLMKARVEAADRMLTERASVNVRHLSRRAKAIKAKAGEAQRASSEKREIDTESGPIVDSGDEGPG